MSKKEAFIHSQRHAAEYSGLMLFLGAMAYLIGRRFENLEGQAGELNVLITELHNEVFADKRQPEDTSAIKESYEKRTL